MSRISGPTRRSFLAMLGAGVAALALRRTLAAIAVEAVAEVDPPPPPPRPTRWIGHC